MTSSYRIVLASRVHRHETLKTAQQMSVAIQEHAAEMPGVIDTPHSNLCRLTGPPPAPTLK